MKNLQCSVIIPVFNEKEGIEEFIHSLYQQTRTPDEIIVIDGGSTDGTYEYLQRQQEEKKLHVYRHLSNIAEARNFAIQKAHHEIILCTDAGCKVDNHRCEELMKIYETTDAKLVGGKSEFIAHTLFQRHAKSLLLSKDPSFHFVSSRNISFYKQARKDAGEYPEYLTKRGEDTYFNYRLEQAGYPMVYCPQAIVARHMGKDFTAFYKMYRNYTQGDAEVWTIHHVVQSNSIKQGIIGTWALIILIILSMSTSYGILLSLGILACMGIYKRSSGWYLFDLKFNITKTRGILYGFRRGIIVGYAIKKKMKITT